MTSLILLFIKYVCRVPLRMTEEQLMVGDDAVHGEDAYAFGPDVHPSQRSHLYGDTGRQPTDSEMGPTIHGESPVGGNGDSDVGAKEK
jgi:Amt family ammonium transporter